MNHNAYATEHGCEDPTSASRKANMLRVRPNKEREVSATLYRQAFAVVGYDLSEADELPDTEIVDAEREMGCSVPSALREFYRLAGNARRVINHYDQFLRPHQWSLEDGKVVFLEENQAVVLYAVDATVPAVDPPVVIAANWGDDPYEWHEVCRSCSEFLRVMVHWEGSFGGAMPTGGTAIVDPSIQSTLAAKFQYAGEVNKMRAYGTPGLAICLVEWDDGWRIFVGATEERRLDEIRLLGVDFM
jgi:hypothetical protein